MTSDLKNGGVVDSEAVCVAVHIRPLIPQEFELGCKPCLEVTPGTPQVGHGPHRFTYDHVFGGEFGKDPTRMYDQCVSPLINGLFKGYNATVFAYGQTGSGKTYTMGSSFPLDPTVPFQGMIPRAMDAIFARMADFPSTVFTVRVGFVEIHQESIRDLISRRPGAPVHVRELPGGGILLSGAVEKEVRTKEEMIAVLESGTAMRATAETGMNKRSSRSHAIFSISLEQRSQQDSPTAYENGSSASNGGGKQNADDTNSDSTDDEEDEGIDEFLCAKLHLVDLAGSERAKRTKAQGQRLQEGITINKGLLALGNVINALSEGKSHVPYRDSKLTRMLQDSLGGNSRTLMIACVSPADVNLEESLNTLRYANRARNIKNKPVVNRDPAAAQIAALRQQLAAAKAENVELRRQLGMAGGLSPRGELGIMSGTADDPRYAELMQALRESEARVATLRRELADARTEAGQLREELRAENEARLRVAMQRDKAVKALEAVAGKDAVLEAIGISNTKTLESEMADRVRDLEEELRRLRRASISGAALHAMIPDYSGATPVTSAGRPLLSSPFASAGADGLLSGFSDESEEAFLAEERARHAELAKVQSEMDALQRQLESKEAAIAAVSNHTAMRNSYETQLRELQNERDTLAKERTELLAKLRALQAASSEERSRLERTYKDRMRELDQRVKSVDTKEAQIRKLEAAQKRAQGTVHALERDVQAIKEAKVALQRQAAKAAKEHEAWRKSREKEMLHLRKEGRANASQLIRMEALHAKQQEVLRRKTEEAIAARKRLKELEGRRRPQRTTVSQEHTSLKSQNSSQRSQPGNDGLRPTLFSGVPSAESRDRDSSSLPSQGPNDASFMAATIDNSTANGVSEAESGGVPLGTNEASRREWVEAELDACTASYELQKILEGEKAMRSEAARQLREVEKRLAAMKNPQWWGQVPTTTPGGLSGEDALRRKQQKLLESSERHGRQIQEIQLALVQARAKEEERGGGAADASRWNGMTGASMEEGRAMMITLFRTASQYKSQAYEAQLALTEMSEEVEMLRLKLEVAEAARLDAEMRAAEVHNVPMENDGQDVTTPTQKGKTAKLPEALLQDAHDFEATSVLEQLDSLSGIRPEVDEEDDWEEDDEETESEEEEEDAWDPSRATPFAGKLKKVKAPGDKRPRLADSSKVFSPRGKRALEGINATRVKRGEVPLERITTAVLREELKGATIHGKPWRGAHKKRAELLQDYLDLLQERHMTVRVVRDVVQPASASSLGELARSEETRMTPPLRSARSADLKVPKERPNSAGGRRSPFSKLTNALRRSPKTGSSLQGSSGSANSRPGSAHGPIGNALRLFAGLGLSQSFDSASSAHVESPMHPQPDLIHREDPQKAQSIELRDTDTTVEGVVEEVRAQLTEEDIHEEEDDILEIDVRILGAENGVSKGNDKGTTAGKSSVADDGRRSTTSGGSTSSAGGSARSLPSGAKRRVWIPS